MAARTYKNERRKHFGFVMNQSERDKLEAVCEFYHSDYSEQLRSLIEIEYHKIQALKVQKLERQSLLGA